MEETRFDALTRSFATRRAALGGVLAALWPFAVAAKPDGKNGGKRKRNARNADHRDDKDRAETVDRKPGNPPADGPEAARCLPNGRRCGKGSGKRGEKDVPCNKCCTRYGTPKSQGPQRCSCKPAGTACANPSQCCGGRCAGGRCDPCQSGLTRCQPDGCVDLRTDRAHCGSCSNACATGQSCQGGACTCRGATCAGCCDGATCKPGTNDGACGANGGACAACSGTGESCGGGGEPGVCGCTPESDATTCDGKCGAVQNNCGQDVDCTAVCAGCCAGGACNAGTTDDACGAGGAACTTCAEGQDCASGSCTCNGASCSGCCDGVTCRAGDTDANCGSNGGVCQTCAGTGVTCGGGGAPGVCGCTAEPPATTCADRCGQVQNNCGQPVDCTPRCAGCCDGGACRAGTSDGACGKDGAECAPCVAGRTCIEQTCSFPPCRVNFIQQPNGSCLCPSGFEEINGGCFEITASVICSGCNAACNGCSSGFDGSSNSLCRTTTENPCLSNAECAIGSACYLPLSQCRIAC